MLSFYILTYATVLCIGLQIYHYLIYPMLLFFLVKFRQPRRPCQSASDFSVSLIISAYNEEGVIEEKLENSFRLDPAPVEILVVANGSTDRTVELAKKWSGREIPVHVLFEPERKGKSAAMNMAAEHAGGDILLFSDANAFYEKATLDAISKGFSDPDVAVVSGAKKVVSSLAGDVQTLLGLSDGLYWRYEAFIRRCESDLGSTVASVGEILSVRRSLWRPIPAGTVNDDAWMTMTNLALGHAVRFAPNAISIELASPSQQIESARRRRINAGRLKLIGTRSVWPLRNLPVLAAFLSHKVLRLFLPFLMIGGFLANALLVALYDVSWVFSMTMVLQIVGLSLVVLGYLATKLDRKWRIPHLAYHVFEGNLVALLAFWDVVLGRSFTIWEKPPR